MYTRVESKFWQDEKMRSVSCDARYLMLYLLTSPHRNILGLYFLPAPYACFDLGWDEQRFNKGLDELLSKGCIKYDKANHVVLIINFLKHNPLDNPNQVKSAIDRLDNLPQTVLIKDLYEVVKHEKPHYEPLVEELGKRLNEPLNNPSETVNETLSKQEEVKEEEEVKEKEYKYNKSDSANPTQPVEILKDDRPSSTPQERIFEHWNSKEIIQHRRMTDKMRRSINGALKDYKESEICTAIDNYAVILADSQRYYWTYKWGLREFLQRGLDKFLDFEIAAQNYKKDGRGQRGLNKQTDFNKFDQHERTKEELEALFVDIEAG